MTGVMILHEIMHETKRRKEVGVILKIYFEKAYDKVNWNFMFECLRLRGFCPQWCSWIKQIVGGGTVRVKLNDKVGLYFHSHERVRQGNLLSPILFNFVADCLARMVRKPQDNNLVRGLIDHQIPTGINFNKSEIILINGDLVLEHEYVDLLNYQVGTFPMKYLGVPVSPSRLYVGDWLPLEEKNSKRLESWKGGSLSMAGRITLINSCLTNAPIYCMSMFLLHKSVVSRVDAKRRKFLWQGGGDKKKYRLIKWKQVYMDKK
ncbi:hypothetical protein U9M48_023053 [Paspalum notatum var. saurae]|uniref:Reverse transcriptase domain-containing protein n=1 Tax=Paspalum notatum var. saurae TaxID=547442 RepID=A0AAQ3TJ06_PASNO